jgi:ribosomal protein S6--L-glutamate ligase
MRIGLLVTHPHLYSHKRLHEAAVDQGHSLRIINLTECFIKIAPPSSCVYTRGGEMITDLDAVIPRIDTSITFFGTSVIRQLEIQGIYVVNTAPAILKARDKFHAIQLLAAHDIAVPPTSIGFSGQADAVIDATGGAPVIVKLVEGSEGIGVMLAETAASAKSIMTAFRQVRTNVLIQKYVSECKGRDLRCFVIGDRVVGAMERIAQNGEFRANFHLGAQVKKATLSIEEEAIAIKATQLMGLDVAGVDILRSNRGPQVIEINASPGLEGIERATGKDIAGMIIEYIKYTHSRRAPQAVGAEVPYPVVDIDYAAV